MDNAKLFPLGNKVLLRIKPVSEETKGGLIIPQDTHYKRQMAEMEAEVMQLGDEAFIDHNLSPKVGDWVIISKHAGLLYPNDGEDWRIIEDIHIQAILRKEQ